MMHRDVSTHTYTVYYMSRQYIVDDAEGQMSKLSSQVALHDRRTYVLILRKRHRNQIAERANMAQISFMLYISASGKISLLCQPTKARASH